MPRDVNGDKWACEPCVRGHRSSKCEHFERLMIRVKKPGRPLTQCPHPPGECNCEFDRVMMVRIIEGDAGPGKGAASGTSAVGCTCVAQFYVDKKGNRRGVGPDGAPLPYPPVPSNNGVTLQQGKEVAIGDPDAFRAPMPPPMSNQPPHAGNNHASAVRQIPNMVSTGQQQHQTMPVQGRQGPQYRIVAVEGHQVQYQILDGLPEQPQQQTPPENHRPPQSIGHAAGRTIATSSVRANTNGFTATTAPVPQGYADPDAMEYDCCGSEATFAEKSSAAACCDPVQSMPMSDNTNAPVFKVEEQQSQQATSPNGVDNATFWTSSPSGDGTGYITPMTTSSHSTSQGETGLLKANGTRDVVDHFHELSRHPKFKAQAFTNRMQYRAAHDRYSDEACICGPGCTCFGCLAHPLNRGTQNSMLDLRNLMEEDSSLTSSPTNTLKNALDQSQDSTASFNVHGGIDTALAPEPGMPHELTAPPQPPQLKTAEGNFAMSSTGNETFIFYYPQDNQQLTDPSGFGPALYPSGDYACVDPSVMGGNMFNSGLTDNEFPEFVNDTNENTTTSQFADDNEALAQFRSRHADPPN